MNISVFWHKPIELQDGSDENLIYTVGDLGKFEDVPGVYIFGRLYSGVLSPLYIGKAQDLAARIRQQLNTTKLMMAVQDAPSGTRVLALGELHCKPGQNVDTCIRLVEKALIEHALAEGHDLINFQGTRTPYDEIAFTGNSTMKAFTGPQMLRKKTGG